MIADDPSHGVAVYPWSARRWMTMVFLAFTGQILLLWAFGERPAREQPPAVFSTRIEMLAPDWSDFGLDPWVLLSDPAVVPMSGPHGFSGEAWLHHRPVDHAFTHWTDRLEILPPDARQLGGPLMASLENNPVRPLRVAETGLPEPDADRLVVPSLRPPEQTWLERGGGLRQRPLLGTPELPSWPRQEILTQSVVRVVVWPDGSVLSATILQPCGLPAADAHALAFAKAARFEPLPLEPAPETAFGFLTFHWHTLPSADPSNTAQQDR